MNDIRFTKTNGGIPRPTANEDPISALLMVFPDVENCPGEWTEVVADSLFVAKFQYLEQLRELGIEERQLATTKVTSSQMDSDDADDFELEYEQDSAINALIYHVSEFFRMNPNGTLYVGLVPDAADVTAASITALQNYTDGKIRQVGILTPALTNLAAYQTEAGILESNHKPLSIVIAPTGFTIAVSCTPASSAGTDGKYHNTLDITKTAVPAMAMSSLKDVANTKVAGGRTNVSVLIGTDLDETLGAKLGTYKSYGCIGTCLGAISKAAVNECIAWVQKFPLGLAKPGLISGEAINTVSEANQNDLNANHLIFARLHVGIADCYFNDSWTLDLDTSDYCYIERVRTIDKACRGVRANLLPYLNSPLKVDAETGKLAQSTVAFLQTTAGRALEDMEKADELSGYVVEIDPEQNVIATSTLQVVIKQVPTGVMRNVNIKIGFTTAIG